MHQLFFTLQPLNHFCVSSLEFNSDLCSHWTPFSLISIKFLLRVHTWNRLTRTGFMVNTSQNQNLRKPNDQDPVPFLGNAQEARVCEQETGRGVNDCCISYTLSLSEASDSKQWEEMLEIKRKINRSHLWKLSVVCWINCSYQMNGTVLVASFISQSAADSA